MEDSGFQGVGFNLHGELSYVEADSDSNPSQELRYVDMCREDTMGILQYLMVWKPEWNSSKDLLRRLGWTMVDAAMMIPNPVEVP